MRLAVSAVVAAAAMFASAYAGAATLKVEYIGEGLDLMWEQTAEPTPISFSSEITYVAVDDFTGAGPYPAINYYTAIGFGGFETPDFKIDAFGPQLFSGTTEDPVFSPGSFSLITPGGDPAGVITFSAVPEPSTWAMMLLGLGGLGLVGHRSRRRSGIGQQSASAWGGARRDSEQRPKGRGITVTGLR